MKKVYSFLWSILPYVAMPLVILYDDGVRDLAYFAVWAQLSVSLALLLVLGLLLGGITAFMHWAIADHEKAIDWPSAGHLDPQAPWRVAIRIVFVAVAAYYGYFGIATVGFLNLLLITALYMLLQSIQKAVKEHNAKYAS